MTRRQELYRLITDNLNHSPSISKIRWIMDSNGWETAEDVRDKATDVQVEAIFTVWGLDAYAC